MTAVPALEAALELPPVTAQGFGVAAAVIAGGVLLAWVLRRGLRVLLLWRGRSPSSADVFARLVGWVTIVLAVLAALTIMFPSVKPVDVLGGVGVVSIAAGIAFQTVLGNMFAGIVILARDRYRVGDQISVQEQRGTVVDMRLTSTSIRTFDGRLVLIPNALLHSQVVTVQTGFEHIRTTVGLDLDDATDLDLACDAARRAMARLPEVLDEPAPQALLVAVGLATVHLELRFWSGATQLETREAQHAVIRRVVADFRQCGVALGSDILLVDASPRLLGALADRAHPGFSAGA